MRTSAMQGRPDHRVTKRCARKMGPIQRKMSITSGNGRKTDPANPTRAKYPAQFSPGHPLFLQPEMLEFVALDLGAVFSSFGDLAKVNTPLPTVALAKSTHVGNRIYFCAPS